MAINIKQFSGTPGTNQGTVYTVPANTTAKLILNYWDTGGVTGSSTISGRPWISGSLSYGGTVQFASNFTASYPTLSENQSLASTPGGSAGTPVVINTVVYMGPGETVTMSNVTYSFQVIEQL